MADEQTVDGATIIEGWVQSFVKDLGVIRSAATVRAYVSDLRHWIGFCQDREVHPFREPQSGDRVHPVRTGTQLST